MTAPAEIWRRLRCLLTAPVRRFRQRTIAQLMVSHVAVVLITFLLLNVLVFAVMLGWLPGRQLFGLQDASQDMFLGERTRAMAVWLDVDDIIAEHGSLDAPAAREALDAQLARIITNDVPGYELSESATAGSVNAYWGVPRVALATDATGVVVASTDPDVAAPGEPIEEIGRAGLRRAIEHVDGVVDHAFDEQPEALLACGERAGALRDARLELLARGLQLREQRAEHESSHDHGADENEEQQQRLVTRLIGERTAELPQAVPERHAADDSAGRRDFALAEAKRRPDHERHHDEGAAGGAADHHVSGGEQHQRK
jgi:hypothetical protein